MSLKRRVRPLQTGSLMTDHGGPAADWLDHVMRDSIARSVAKWCGLLIGVFLLCCVVRRVIVLRLWSGLSAKD